MPLDIKKLREEFTKNQTDASTLIEKVTGEKRDLTDEEKQANETRFSRMKQIKTAIDEDSKFAGLALAGGVDDDDSKKGAVQLPTDPPGREEFSGKAAADLPDPFDLNDAEKKAYRREVNSYGRTGEMGARARKFATITTTTGSGILLPKAIAQPITPSSANAFREAYAYYDQQPIETSTTGDLTVPVLDASSGGVVAENASTDTENEPDTSQSIRLTVKTFESGSVWFSNQQLAANDFDIVANVLPQLTYSKELGLESAIVAALIADGTISQSVVTSATNGFTYSNLVDLNRALPKRYSAQRAIALSAAAFSAAEKLIGSDGHPVLIMDPQTDGLVRFNGTPVFRSDYLQSFGATQTIGVAFSLLGLKIRDVTVQNLARYVNIPTRPNQTGLNLFAYHGYGWAPSAVAKLITPAS